MRRRLGLFLTTALTLCFLLAFSTAPVLAEETPVPCDPESGYVTGSEGTGEVLTLGEGVEVPAEVTPMEKTVDGVLLTEGTDETGAVETGGTDDRMYALTASNALDADGSASLPWLLMAGIGLAGLLAGFVTGWLVRGPAKVPTIPG